MTTISPRLSAYLTKWFDTSTGRMRKKGVVVTITLAQFVSIIKPSQLRTLEKAVEAKRLRYLQRSDNPYAYVITWKSYKARASNVFSLDTATFCSRQKSLKINLPQKGDKLTQQHCASISKSLKGVEKTDEHKANLSSALKGAKKVEWTPQRRADRKALNDVKRAAKAEEAKA